MAEIQQWIFLITPMPHIRFLDREGWKRHASDEYLKNYGMKKHLADVAAMKTNPIRANATLNRKNRMIALENYKMALRADANIKKFMMPESGAYIKFYLPMPKSWSKKKRNANSFQEHKVAPDVDNLLKPLIDALVKKDQVISDYRASKFWYDSNMNKGFIAITFGELKPPVGYMITRWENNNFI